MTTFAQTSPLNDLAVSSDGKDFAFATGREAYANIITDTVRTMLGEIQLDESIGVDYFNTVFDLSTRVAFWKDAVDKIINSYDFVTTILSFDVNYNSETHVMKYKIVILTNDGEIIVES